MTRMIAATIVALGTLILGLGTPESARAAPAALGTLAGIAAPDGGQVHKVHTWRGRWHCESRHDHHRGWHWHRRACRDHGYRHKPRSHRGHRGYDRKGCSWHPRHGLRCNF